MQENHHINKYMIEFSEHAAYTGWNDTALYGEFYWGLAKRLKDQLLNMDRPRTLDQLKIDALKCDNRYWERQHEKGPTPSTSRPRPSTTTSTSTASQPARPSTNPRPAQGDGLNQVRKDLGNILGSDGKLTEAERERRRSKNLCFYCGERPESHAKDCRNRPNATPVTTGWATFTLLGDPAEVATIEEVTEGTLTPSGN